MGGKTPFEKLEEVWDGMINKGVVDFPVITLEWLGSRVASAVGWFSKYRPLSLILQGGKYLPSAMRIAQEIFLKCVHLITSTSLSPTDTPPPFSISPRFASVPLLGFSRAMSLCILQPIWRISLLDRYLSPSFSA